MTTSLLPRLKEMLERWLPVPGYPAYLISDHGRLMGMGPKKDGFRLIKPNISRKGYHIVELYPGGAKRGKRFQIHRLVLMAFVGPAKTEQVGSHFDDVKTNNHISNLSWATAAENRKLAMANERYLRGHKHPMAKLSADDVEYIRKHYKQTGYHRSNTLELAKKFGVRPTTISMVAYNRSHVDKALQALRDEVEKT